MKRSTRWVAGAMIMLGLLGTSTAAHATVLAPGNTVFATNLGAFTSGSVVSDSGNVAFNFGGNTGTIREWVFRMPPLLYALAACPSYIRFR